MAHYGAVKTNELQLHTALCANPNNGIVEKYAPEDYCSTEPFLES